MAKIKTTYFCQNCGAQAAKFIGHCPSCGEWNTYVEEVVEKSNDTAHGWEKKSRSTRADKPKLITEIRSCTLR